MVRDATTPSLYKVILLRGNGNSSRKRISVEIADKVNGKILIRSDKVFTQHGEKDFFNHPPVRGLHAHPNPAGVD